MSKIEDIKDFGNLGKYKVRLISIDSSWYLDIREYIESENYTGFTKKGACLHTEFLERLLKILNQVKEMEEK